ncbi:PREDICTED: uncharacterized protein LOC108756036 isoform X2 [Trachymyrmex septentrionalis]|uniref:uncharacterized protein LOC108756036 isoform X2 n=1 Tax=Trachymyrmex septentrionalis TaxID=34720 RepID=UPI00084F6D50|nr:PREDICTED: uncharacterized protein LOC108756036 isoform X2 [Trachymyrmex septentrionalis]
MKKWFSVPNVTDIVSDHPVLLTFHNKEIWTALEAALAKAKKVYYEKFHIYSKECKVTEEQNLLFNKIKEIVEKVSVTGLLQEWEDNIYELTNQSKIRDKFVNIFENQIQEIKDQYYETMRNMAICRTIAIKCENVYNQDMFIISSFKEKEECFNRTIFAKKFSRNRCAIAKQYYLSHQLIKNIVVKAHLLLPEIFCDFGRCHSVEFIDFDKYINT